VGKILLILAGPQEDDSPKDSGMGGNLRDLRRSSHYPQRSEVAPPPSGLPAEEEGD